jgi:aspartate carbamoyltransferase catalytic subunit
MESCTVAFKAKSSHSDLQLQVRLNGQVVLDPVLTSTEQDFSFEFADIDGAINTVEFELSGKSTAHTVVNDTGEITHDELITISAVSVDEMVLGHLFTEKAVYQHNFNGTQPMINDQFFGEMGCNGVVQFQFSGPFNLWLLENM